MYLGLPQIIYLAITILGLGYQIANHGKPRSNENAIAALIATAISLALLYWGGFFSHV
jgi:hypothetical protein